MITKPVGVKIVSLHPLKRRIIFVMNTREIEQAITGYQKEVFNNLD